MLDTCLPPEWQSAKATHRIRVPVCDDGATHSVLVTLERGMS